MRIGDLARRTGLSTRALRYYEEQGLLTPRRNTSGYREYAEADVLTVRRIRVMLAAGLNTHFIGDVLPCITAGGTVVQEPMCPELRDELTREHERLSGRITELDQARAMLTAIIDAPARLITPTGS